MAWPLSQDYNEAIQSPASSFSDPELRQGEPVLNPLGLPMPRSGNFADVYEFNCPTTKHKWAVKCFTREIPGIRERYIAVSKYLKENPLPFMVEFTYLDQGMRIRGQWYPILKMQWVEGFTLNQFVKDYLDKPQLLDTLGQMWVKLSRRLRDVNLAHCDLQHGNVLMVPGTKGASLGLRLVDYDGMCVPALTELKSIEVGHPNFQHPLRIRKGGYGLEVDRFSHLVIYAALRCLIVGGKPLWEKYDNGDNLLFKQTDFEAPGESAVFKELLTLKDKQVQTLVQAIRLACQKPIEQSPLLHELVPNTPTTTVPVMSAGGKSAAPIPMQASAESVFAQATGEASGKRRTTKGKFKGEKKSKVGLFVGGALAAVLVLGLGGVAAWVGLSGPKSKQSSPTEVAVVPTALSTSGKTTSLDTRPPTSKPPDIRPPDTKLVETRPPSEPQKGATSVSLASFYNAPGITADGVGFGGGIDGFGWALSSKLLGNSVTWRGANYTIGAPGGNNIVTGAGQTIPLPAGNYTGLSFLGMGIKGHYVNAPFVVTYTDGSTQTYNQSISDWCAAQNFPGEATAVTMTYRNRSNAIKDATTCYVYGYNFVLNPLKQAKSITLPTSINTVNVGVLAIDLTSGSLIVTQPPPLPGTKLAVLPMQDLTVKPGGEAELEIKVDRAGLVGKLSLNLAGLPPGMTTKPVFEKDRVVVKLAAAPDSPEQSYTVTVRAVLADQSAQGTVNVSIAKGSTVPNPPVPMPPDKTGNAPKVLRTLVGHTGPVQLLGFSPDGQRVATPGADRTIKIWDVESGRLLRTLNGHTANVSSVSFMPVGGKLLVSSSDDKTLRLWDGDTGQEIRRFEGHTAKIWNAVFSPDGRFIVSCSDDGTLRMWNTNTGKEMNRYTGHQGTVNRVAFSPDGRQLLSAGWDMTARLWDVSSVQELRRFTGHTNKVSCVAFSPDGTLAVTSSNDRTVGVWDVATGRLLRSLTGHTDEVWHVAVTPDGKHVLSAGRDRSLMLWELKTGRLVQTVPAAHTSAVHALAISPQGNLAISSETLGVVRVWDLGLGGGTPVVVKPDPKPPVPDPKPPMPEVKPPAPAVVKKQPVPEEAKQAENEKLIKAIYREDYAKLRPADRLSLADKLIQKAKDTTDDMPARYSLLKEASTLASLGGDIPKALTGIDQMAQDFAIDVVKMKLDTLTQASRSLAGPTASKVFAENCLSAIDDALTADNYEAAGKLLALAEPALKRVQIPGLVARFESRTKEVAEAQKEFEGSKAAAATLSKQPDNPEASLALGKYLCWGKGEWDKGLPLLAAGSDAALRELARKDLAKPATTPDQVAVGDGWWDLGEAGGGVKKIRLQHRAVEWYRQAREGLSGLAQERLDKRISEIEKASAGLVKLAPTTRETRRLTGHTGKVNAVAFSFDAKRAISAGADGTMRVWDVASGKELINLNVGAGELRSVAFSATGKYGCAITTGGAIELYDLDTKSLVPSTMNNRPSSATCVVFLLDNDKVFVGKTNGWAQVLQLVARNSAMTFTSPEKSAVQSVATAAGLCIFGCADGNIHLHLESGAGNKLPVTKLVGHSQDVLALSLSRDGRVVISGSADSTGRLWDAATGKTLVILKGHQGRVNGAALSPDGRKVVTAGDDKTIRVWDPRSGKELRQLTGHTDAINSIALSPDGRYLLSASSDQTIRVWDLGK